MAVQWWVPGLAITVALWCCFRVSALLRAAAQTRLRAELRSEAAGEGRICSPCRAGTKAGARPLEDTNMRTILIALALFTTTSAFALQRGEYGGDHGEGPSHSHSEGGANSHSTSPPPPNNGMTDADYEDAYDDPSVGPEIDGNYERPSQDCPGGCEVPEDVK